MNFRYPDKPSRGNDLFFAHTNPTEWVAQAKYDGWRLPTIFENGSFRCFSRIGTVAKPRIQGGKFPLTPKILDALTQISKSVPNGTVLDGELVGPRGHLEPGIYFFDVLAYNGSWLCQTSFQERWKTLLGLKHLWDGSPFIMTAKTVENDFEKFYRQLEGEWKGKGGGLDLYEGLVLKKRSGTLSLNFRENIKSRDSVKIKYREGSCGKF